MKNLKTMIYFLLDKVYILLDRSFMKRSANLKLIPNARQRKGGKISSIEWGHVIGIFQTLIWQHLPKNNNHWSRILDIGCGSGLIGIASHQFIGKKVKYLGIDVMKKEIEKCKKLFSGNKGIDFLHFDLHNSYYANEQREKKLQWEVEDATIDLVTALSVWTHMNEGDAIFYLKEVHRVLKENGRAIISFFYMDEDYLSRDLKRENRMGKYHLTNQLKWRFTEQVNDSENWFTTSWANPPEKAIAINSNAMKRLCQKSGLTIKEYYPGNWKESEGLYFQDIVVFEKIEIKMND